MMLFDDEQRKAIIYCGIAFFAGCVLVAFMDYIGVYQ